MMLKVTAINSLVPFEVTCCLNNGEKRKIDVLPLIHNHAHLQGINKLLEDEVFMRAEIGTWGEIVWRDIILAHDGSFMDYDISPEFIYYRGQVAR